MVTTIELRDDPKSCISDNDVAQLADWAAKQLHLCSAAQSKAFQLMREGADLLLRRRARKDGKQ